MIHATGCYPEDRRLHPDEIGRPDAAQKCQVADFDFGVYRNALDQALKDLRRTRADTVNNRRSAEWKLALAAWMETRTQASNRWLADKVHLGTPAVLSRNLTRYYRERQSDDLTWKRLTSKSAT